MKLIICISVLFLGACSNAQIQKNKTEYSKDVNDIVTKNDEKPSVGATVNFYSDAAGAMKQATDLYVAKKYDKAINVLKTVKDIKNVEKDYKAEALFRLAKIYSNYFYEKKDKTVSKDYCEQILDKYPETEYAVSARQMLTNL